jgi:hypothetical protein
MNPNPNLPEDFWRYVDKSTDCWKWRGAFSGMKPVYKFQGQQHQVSRLICEDLPPNKYIDRNCNNLRCINPAHLFYVGVGVEPAKPIPFKLIELRDPKSLTIEEKSDIMKEPKRRGYIQHLIEKYRVDYYTINRVRLGKF